MVRGVGAVSAVQKERLKFLLEQNIRLNGLTTLIKNFNISKPKTLMNIIDITNKNSISDINRNSKSGKSKSVFSIHPPVKGSIVDILA
ncbi:MAG: hypothetical protein ACK4NF_06270 [Planctomycetota bacterium]